MNEIAKYLETINELNSKIYQSFSYEGIWKVYPIDDSHLDCYWFTDGSDIFWVKNIENLKSFLPKNNFPSEDNSIDFFVKNKIFSYTKYLIKDFGESKCGNYSGFIVDTSYDNYVLFLFDNKKNYSEALKNYFAMSDKEHSKLVYLLDAIKLEMKSKTSMEKIKSLIDVVNCNGSNKFKSYINQIMAASMEDIEKVICTIREDIR